MNNKVTVTINSMNYTIVGAEREDYVQQIAAKVDSEIQDILAEGPHISGLMASVLSSMNFCDKMTKSEETAANLRAQIKVYYEELSQTKAECDAMKKEMASMNRELQSLRAQLAARSPASKA